jgi:hypothetical protein
MLKGESRGDSPAPNQDPALSAKVDGRQGATSYGLMDPSLLFMIHFLTSMLRSLMVAIMTKKPKDHFPPRQWSSFLCFTFLSGSLVQ